MVPHVIDLKKLPAQSRAAAAVPGMPKTVPDDDAIEKDGGRSTAAPVTYLAWEAPEFENIGKSRAWYLALAGITAALIAVMIRLGDFFAALFFAVAGFVVWLLAGKEPRVMRFAVTSRGVEAGERAYLFDSLSSFWIFYDPPRKSELSLRSKHVFMPYVRMPLGSADPVEIRKHLIRFIPERKHKESVADELARSIGF